MGSPQHAVEGRNPHQEDWYTGLEEVVFNLNPSAYHLGSKYTRYLEHDYADDSYSTICGLQYRLWKRGAWRPHQYLALTDEPPRGSRPCKLCLSQRAKIEAELGLAH